MFAHLFFGRERPAVPGLLQPFPELFPAAADTGLDRPDRPLDDPGDLLLGETLHVLEDDRDAVAGMQFVQGLAEVPDEPGVSRVLIVCSAREIIGDVLERDARFEAMV
jgi:hypothetical protein